MAAPSPRSLGVRTADRIYMKVHNFVFRVRQGEFEDSSSSEPKRPYTEAGDMGIKPIWIGFTKRNGKFYLELTGMTTEELDAFEVGMRDAITAARAVVAYLDEHADVEYDDDGDTVIPLRAIKSPPVVVHREIRPFAGTDIDPLDTRAERRAYENAHVD
jgi:hypothetical protein